ncbi:unnamed protein product, partial [Soboliphyme baturini]|uniref:protein-tyrosine-phosphatase n=1 Tax=Soboliphyme baturini TaxID=241478 RepID=A0A183J9V4_9BILA
TATAVAPDTTKQSDGTYYKYSRLSETLVVLVETTIWLFLDKIISLVRSLLNELLIICIIISYDLNHCIMIVCFVGGFSDFQSRYPELCENTVSSINTQLDPPDWFLTFQSNNITYVINLSATCPKSCLIEETNFLRIPVMDSNSEKIISHFERAFHFLDKALKTGANVLVHCLAGVSRSPTFVIAYIMRERGLSVEEAYRFVKECRPCIAPNFNFLGQLMQYEKQLTEKVNKGMNVVATTTGRKHCSKFGLSDLSLVNHELTKNCASLKVGAEVRGNVVVAGQANPSASATTALTTVILRNKQHHEHREQPDRYKHRSSLVVSIGAACLPVVRDSAKCIFRRISPIKTQATKPVVAFVRQSSIS